MKQWIEKSVAITERILIARYCDFCGREIKQQDAKPWGDAVWDITIEATSTLSHEHEATVERTVVDCCGHCWLAVEAALKGLRPRFAIVSEKSIISVEEDGQG